MGLTSGLPEVIVNGSFDPGYDPFGPEFYWMRDYYSNQFQQSSDGGGAAGGSSGESQVDPLPEVEVEAFVAPPLPPVLVPPPVAVAPTIIETVIAALTRAVPFALPFVPTPIGEEPQAETLPNRFSPNVDPLPEVTVTGARPPVITPPKVPPYAYFEPPNWNDMLEWPGVSRPIFAPRGFPDDREDRTSDRERPNPRDRSSPRSPGIIDAIDEVVVTGRKASPRGTSLPAPNLFAFPIGDPFSVPLGDPFAEPLAQPRAEPAPRVKTIPKTGVIIDVVPRTGLSPVDDLFTVFEPFVATPTPTQRTVPVPVGDVVPVAPRGPSLAPVVPTLLEPGLDEDPLTDTEPKRADPCNCAKEKPKTKESKKRRPRQRCYRGTYIETRSSTKKTPREEIPCP